MSHIFVVLWPETLLVVVGALLLLLGVVNSATARRAAPVVALVSLLAVFIALAVHGVRGETLTDPWHTLLVSSFQEYVKLITAGAGVLLVLLAWPTNSDATGNTSILYGHEASEFFGLMLLSLAGILFVASANDIILLFLGIELASIPTYILVSISRPLPVAQEAGVKYFFLGAMAAAVMLFGFSYLYGTTGFTRLSDIATAMHLNAPGHDWQLMAVVLLVIGFGFKIAAVPMHTYVGDVYQGAATPVTAFLGFVPKTSGFVALIKVLYFVGLSGSAHFLLPDAIGKLLWILAVLTMSVGNVLALLQFNIKRVLAYSSIAHSGYMLAGVAVMVTSRDPGIQAAALGGVLFYLAAYALMNTGAMAVLTILPGRQTGVAGYLMPADSETPVSATAGTGAETYDDLAGQGRHHLSLGLCMAAFCWSLTGLPFTVGFFGKVFLIQPAIEASHGGAVPVRMFWLFLLVLLNAGIAAVYYLRIIGALFLRPEPAASTAAPGAHVPVAAARPIGYPLPVMAAVALSVVGTIAFGVDFPAVSHLARRTRSVQIERPQAQTPPVVASVR